MPKVDFQRLPDDARLWVFGVERPLTEEEERLLLEGVDDFLESWKAHGTPLVCARELRHGRFLLVGVDERSAPPSGCSIDAMVHLLKGLEARLRVGLVDNTPIWFMDQQEVRRVERGTFRELARSGEVGPGTTVFDNTVTRVGQLRGGEWQRPARDAWHGRAFMGAAR